MPYETPVSYCSINHVLREEIYEFFLAFKQDEAQRRYNLLAGHYMEWETFNPNVPPSTNEYATGLLYQMMGARTRWLIYAGMWDGPDQLLNDLASRLRGRPKFAPLRAVPTPP